MNGVSFDTVQLPGLTFEPMSRAAAETLAPLLANIDPWARYAYTAAALASFLAAEEVDAPRYSIAVDRAIAGAVSIRKNWLRGPYLQFLGILPPYQNQGIGGSVLNWFENQACEASAQNIWVAVSEFNARALSFYERHGFGRVAMLTDSSSREVPRSCYESSFHTVEVRLYGLAQVPALRALKDFTQGKRNISQFSIVQCVVCLRLDHGSRAQPSGILPAIEISSMYLATYRVPKIFVRARNEQS